MTVLDRRIELSPGPMSPGPVSNGGSARDGDGGNTQAIAANDNASHPGPMAPPTNVNDAAGNRLKRGFNTVETARPTPKRRRAAGFMDGFHGTRTETVQQTFLRAAKKHMRVYNYNDCPLPKDHIRLLFLKKNANPEADIVVELKTYPVADLAAHPGDYKYTALSYNWGDGAPTKTVLVDMSATEPKASKVPLTAMVDVATMAVADQFSRNMRTLAVKPNLHAFLKEFRQKDQEVALWVDRICINQESNAEKQDQVSKMHKIYAIASNVSIWLGPADEDRNSDRAMDFIGTILEGDDIGTKLTGDYAQHWSDLLNLMRRRWFSRRWIIQELALAKSAEVRCGSKRKNWHDFADAVSILVLYFEVILEIIEKKPGLVESLDGIRDIRPLGARILVDVLSNTFQRRTDGTIYAPRKGLESLISSLSTFETSDPRDTVYTLLNLAKETFKPPILTAETSAGDAGQQKKRQNTPPPDQDQQGVPPITPPPGANQRRDLTINLSSDRKQKREREINPPPVPDYSIDLLEVYTNFVQWCIKESDSLDIICRHWALPEITKVLDAFYQKLVELPTWIKTVRDSAYGPQTKGLGGRRTGDSFVGTPENRYYNASLGRSPIVSFGRDNPVSPVQQVTQSADNLNVGQSGILSHPQRPSRRRTLKFRRPRRSQEKQSTLTVRGVCIGSVAEAFFMPEGTIPKQVLEALGHDGDRSEIEVVPDSVWRTLVADRDADGKMPPAWYHRACMTCLVADTEFGNLDTNRILNRESPKNTEVLVRNFLGRVRAVCWNRVFIKCDQTDTNTEKTLVGIGPEGSRADDLVCILFGCSVPCILSPVWDPNGNQDYPSHYQLVGEAFILGQMDGEAIADLSEDELNDKAEDFKLR